MTARILAVTVVLLLTGCAACPEGTVSYDMGGAVSAYSMKYHDWQKRGIAPRIVGDCGSACTLALRDPATCYTADARFHFHGVSGRAGYDAPASQAFRAAMPEGVRRWTDEVGAFDSTRVVSITGRDLAAYDGRICK